MLSLIIPAYNEAFELGRTLPAVFEAARALGRPFEIIVVNDASTDATREIALQAGARVVDVQLHQIAAVRNAGAKAAKGEILFFVDADTQISATVLRAACAAIERGAVGGGAWVVFADPVSWGTRVGVYLFGVVYGGILHWAAGCFLFARREAFEAAGGFDETLYASEEIFLSRALKRQGRFVILRDSVRTSARKLRLRSTWEIIPFAWRFLFRGLPMLRQREGLDWWYDGRRED